MIFGAFQHTFLLGELVKRDFATRYRGSILGFAWSFLEPLWQLVLFTLVFSTILRISPLGERTEYFSLFLLTGLLPWIALSGGILRSAGVITAHASFVKSLPFPSQLLVVSSVLTALLHQAIGFVLLIAALFVVGELQPSGLPLLLVAVPLQVALTLGIALALAAVNVFFRDVSQASAMLFSGWFYLTPIVYPLAYVPERLRAWVTLNPMTTLVTMYRAAFLGGELTWVAGTARLTATALLTLVGGAWLFHRLKPAFVDEV